MVSICACGNNSRISVRLPVDVIGFFAANEQRRFRKWSRSGNRLAQLRVIFRDAAQIDFPEKFAGRNSVQDFSAETGAKPNPEFPARAHPRFAAASKTISNPARAARQKFSRARAHRRAEPCPRRPVFPPAGKLQRELHRRLAAHRMADDHRRLNSARS